MISGTKQESGSGCLEEKEGKESPSGDPCDLLKK